ncbi:DinB family protein [Gandjariella thermophila]|uniref:Mini-circle protein n=1 Tax=Gandjariella thermophila TaxID=1931992 RepID=A0A4D4J1J8_9PSEU|nr:DinB family protein [Gandjariella thermophila]GDY30505.1 hypothetical protein GTS_21380 [Gandjariella thermophila]
MPLLVDGGGDEREMLLAYLEAQRAGLRRAVRGLTEEQAAARPTASELSLAGLVKHVARCERGWMARLVDRPDPYPERSQNWAAEFRLGEGETLAGMLALYDEVARETEEIVRGLADLEHSFELPPRSWFAGGKFNARWLLLHLIEETARHAGHADIIRESIDGATVADLMAAEK